MLETLETPVHSRDKNIVLKAIADSPGKITVADIASKTSLPVLQSNALLNQIAYETGAHLAVGTAGSVVYEFSPGFQSAYLSRSSKNFFLRMGRILYNAATYGLRLFALAMFFVIRISFGIMLVLSVVLVVVLIVAAILALLSKMGDDNDSGDGFDLAGTFGGMGGLFRYWVFDWLWDWWYWGSYLRWDPSPQYRDLPGKNRDPQQINADPAARKESFLDKCFSFLFGDGDPNQDLEQRYWQTIALALKANNGVVVAEQLAPYAKTEGKNEDWVLPILVRFNGSCDVSENGNIIYNFPSFQQEFTASTLQAEPEAAPGDLHKEFQNYIKNKKLKQDQTRAVAQLEPYLREHPWEFSHIGSGSRIAIVSFALFILFGGIWLTTQSGTLPILLALQPLLYAISAYGAMFLIIPAIRMLVINTKNGGIERRNAIRYEALNQLQSAEPVLVQKLAEADQSRKESVKKASEERIAFDTERDSLEQEFDN